MLLNHTGWYMVFSVYFHLIFLCTTLKKDHPFFLSMYFLKSNLQNEFKGISLQYAWDDKSKKRVQTEVVEFSQDPSNKKSRVSDSLDLEAESITKKIPGNIDHF